MPVDLVSLVDPASTAVITMEMQRGVCGDLASMPALAEAVDAAGIVGATAALLDSARQQGVAVVHCTFTLLPDRAGTPMNSALMTVLARDPAHLPHGGPAAEIITDLARPGDLESNRHHGFSPFTGTDLDEMLRTRGIRSVIVCGVSSNLGVPGAVIEGVALGYRMIVPNDCVVGLPRDYGEAVIAQTVGVIATVTTSAAIIASWS